MHERVEHLLATVMHSCCPSTIVEVHRAPNSIRLRQNATPFRSPLSMLTILRGLKRLNAYAHGRALLARAIACSSVDGSGSFGEHGRGLGCLHHFLRILHPYSQPF